VLKPRPVPPFVPAAVLTVIVAVLSDRWKARGPFLLIFLPITAAGKFSTYVFAEPQTLTGIITGYVLAIAAKVENLVLSVFVARILSCVF
jgi:MFS-type transporter involved in bile tolerance (Atg22 family)